MRDGIQITGTDASLLHSSNFDPEVDELVSRLEEDGIVVLHDLLPPEQLRAMQLAFGSKLSRVRWNNLDGYQKTERYRHMVEDVLVLDQGFVNLVLHPRVRSVLNRYLGDQCELTE